ncbi:hypothetical protein KSP40_PGU008357 [Platanthera guangdongensis]|uniref:Bet v I/Major latex protein domain-containing protein n=1 Tax=Platanthera guangdongensis TaxID=2320717 RepID=A0ABR2MA49_9ASPA
MTEVPENAGPGGDEPPAARRIMVAGSLTREHISTVAVDRVWKAGVLDSHNLIPKLLPDFIASARSSKATASRHCQKLTFSDAVKEFRFVKDRVEVIDHEKFTVKQAVIEGGMIGKRLRSYSYEMKFEVGSNGGTVGKIRLEYDTQDDTLLGAEEEEQMWRDCL